MGLQQSWLPLESAADHGKALHPAGLGKVTIAARQGSKWVQSFYWVKDLPYLLRAVQGNPDMYISQNRFWGTRRIANLAQLDALFADVDFYKVPDLAGRKPWHVAELVRQALQEAHLPQPSFVVSSGRGVYPVWLHEPVPRQALPRWNACQRIIHEVLRPFGADARAKDAARVLRLIGTKHSGTGAVVEALTEAAAPWSFDTLADEILPIARGELVDLRVRRAARNAVRPADGFFTAPEGFTQATLWEARLTDLQRLLQIRWFGHLPPGQRDNWLFLAGVAMSWLAIPLVLHRELYTLAHQVGGWNECEASRRLGSVLNRAHAAARGEKIEWMGREWDARYRFKTETILDWLEINDEEQRELRTLIGPDLARERHAQAERERTYRTGQVKTDRDTYLAQAKQRREQAQELRSQGVSLRQIAKTLGISLGAVQAMLKP